MTCRMCDKLEPRGCGKTCCAVDGVVIRDFDEPCKLTDKKEVVFNCPPLNYSGKRNEQNT